MISKSLNFIWLLFTGLFLTLIPLQAQEMSEVKPQVGTTQKIGDIILFALPTATVCTSFILSDEKGAWQFTKGLLLTVGVTYGLKYSINKQRPDMSNNNSFHLVTPQRRFIVLVLSINAMGLNIVFQLMHLQGLQLRVE